MLSALNNAGGLLNLLAGKTLSKVCYVVNQLKWCFPLIICMKWVSAKKDHCVLIHFSKLTLCEVTKGSDTPFHMSGHTHHLSLFETACCRTSHCDNVAFIFWFHQLNAAEVKNLSNAANTGLSWDFFFWSDLPCFLSHSSVKRLKGDTDPGFGQCSQALTGGQRFDDLWVWNGN